MKIFKMPIPFNNDYTGNWREREAAHTQQVKEWLVAHGYMGRNTGRVLRMQVADGYAYYMAMEKGSKLELIHLDYGDGYRYVGIEHFPKSKIIELLDSQDRLQAFFAKQA